MKNDFLLRKLSEQLNARKFSAMMSQLCTTLILTFTPQLRTFIHPILVLSFEDYLKQFLGLFSPLITTFLFFSEVSFFQTMKPLYSFYCSPNNMIQENKGENNTLVGAYYVLGIMLGLLYTLSHFNLHSNPVRRLMFFTFCKWGPRVLEVTFTSHLSEFLQSASVQAEFSPDLLGDQTVVFHHSLLVHLPGHSILRIHGFLSYKIGLIPYLF